MAADEGFLSVNLDSEAFRAALSALKRLQMDAAVARALSDAQKSAKSKAVSEIAKHMGVRGGGSGKLTREDIREKLITPFVTKGIWVAQIKASRKPWPLINFNVKRTASGVSTTAWGKRQNIPHAFIAVVGNGHEGVFFRRKAGGRRGKSYLKKIKELWGPTISRTFTTPAVRETIREAILKSFPKALARQIKRGVYAASKAAARRK